MTRHKQYSLRKALNKKLETLDTIPNINEGGCAHVALHASRLASSIGLPNQVVYLYRHWDYDYVQDITAGEPVSCAHAVLRMGNKYYDTEGVYSSEDLRTDHDMHYFIPVPLDLVTKSIKYGDWNRRFKASMYAPAIERFLSQL
jgi:hypothetical protein